MYKKVISEKGHTRRKAVALDYDSETDGAPKVVSKGQGKLAEKIIQIASANNVPIREDPLLVAALADIDLGEKIPPELYLVVAEVFAYIYRVREMLNAERAAK